MTQHRIDTVRNLYEAFKQKDVPAIFAPFDPAAEIIQTEELPWGGYYKGREEAGVFLTKLSQNVTSAVTLDAVFEAGEKVVALGRTKGSVNNGTGRTFDIVVSHVYTFGADGKITKTEYYIDTPAMLEVL